jgi:hypothetical protein
MIEPADQRLSPSRSGKEGPRSGELAPRAAAPLRLAHFAEQPRPMLRQQTAGTGTEKSFASIGVALGRLVQGTWRRRFLIVMPVLLMIPLSIAAAILLPRAYVAQTLLQLQENVRDDPLGRGPPAQESIAQRVPGLEALLKSEQLLSRVIDDVGPPEARASAKATALRIRELQKGLSLQLVGTDFLMIRLRGNKSEGLGSELEAIVSRFLEALVADDGSISASQLIVRRRGEELQQAERTLADLRKRAQQPLPQGVEGAAQEAALLERDRLNRQIQQSERELAAAREMHESFVKRHAGMRPLRGGTILNAPGQIKVIDPPKDPIFAATSRLLFVLTSLGASLLLGIGLAWGAEMLDPTIRHADELVAATGVPTLAHLPRINGEAEQRARPQRPPRSAGYWLLAFVVIIAMGGAGYVLAVRFNLAPQVNEALDTIRTTVSTTLQRWKADLP